MAAIRSAVATLPLRDVLDERADAPKKPADTLPATDLPCPVDEPTAFDLPNHEPEHHGPPAAELLGQADQDRWMEYHQVPLLDSPAVAAPPALDRHPMAGVNQPGYDGRSSRCAKAPTPQRW